MEQIAHTSIVALQYNILSLVKRFNDYETIGGLFREVEKGSLELTIAERIWGVVMETVIAIANLFGLTDEEVLEVVVCRSDEQSPISIDVLEKAIPDIDWRRGHSGQLLSEEDAEKLNELWNNINKANRNE